MISWYNCISYQLDTVYMISRKMKKEDGISEASRKIATDAFDKLL